MSKQIFDKKLLDILICPVSKEQLIYDEKNNELNWMTPGKLIKVLWIQTDSNLGTKLIMKAKG